MMTRYGLVFLVFLMMGCQSLTIFRPQAVESDIQAEFQQAMQFLKQQEYQKAAHVYLRIFREYPKHPRGQEAGILGQELQNLVSHAQSLTVSKEIALKDMREMTQKLKQLSDTNAERGALNSRLRSELRQMEKRLTGLEEENRRFRTNIERLKESLKEFHEIEKEMKPPIEIPPQSKEVGP